MKTINYNCSETETIEKGFENYKNKIIFHIFNRAVAITSKSEKSFSKYFK